MLTVRRPRPRTQARPPTCEPLEPRSLLSGTLLHAYTPHLLNGTGSDVVATIGNMISKGQAFSDMHVVLTWDDGSITFGQLFGHLNPDGPTAAHPPLDITIGQSTHTLGAHSALVFVYQTNAAGKIINYTLFTSHVTIDQNSANGLDLTATAGQPFSGKVATLTRLNIPDSYSGQTGNFTIPEPGGIYASQYAVTIAWGDGTSSIATVVKNTAGTWDVEGSHTYAHAGNYHMTVTASDHVVLGPSAPPQTVVPGLGMLIETEVSTAAVSGPSAAPTVFVNATHAFTLPVANLAAIPANPVYIYWGDGTKSLATYNTLTDGTVQVLGSHTYHKNGLFQIEVRSLFDNAVDLFTTATVNPANTVLLPPIQTIGLTPIDFVAA